MKAWLKGGLIALVLGIIMIIITLIVLFIRDWNVWDWGKLEFLYKFLMLIVQLVGFLPLLLLECCTGERGSILEFLLPILSIFIIVPLELFLTGALIGWIVGKIKSRKHRNN